jgi:hypothetical protein
VGVRGGRTGTVRHTVTPLSHGLACTAATTGGSNLLNFADTWARTALSWHNTKRRVVTLYRRIGRTYRFHLQGLRSPFLFRLEMGAIGCPETSVKGHRSELCNTPEERRSHQHCDGSPKSEISAPSPGLYFSTQTFHTELVARLTQTFGCLPAVSFTCGHQRRSKAGCSALLPHVWRHTSVNCHQYRVNSRVITSRPNHAWQTVESVHRTLPNPSLLTMFT